MSGTYVATDVNLPSARAPYLALLRPSHWVKNLLVFAGIVFSLRLGSWPDLWRVAALFACFCALASAVYVFNDWWDAPQDRLDPSKAGRPLAAGLVSAPRALTLAGALAAAGLAGSWLLDPLTGVLCGTYLTVNALYSVRLKREPILDVGCIALGFVLRAFAGATVIAVPISRWLLLCSIFLALFLGFTKRRQEITGLRGQAERHRAVLSEYSPVFLDHMTGILAAATLVCYTLYTVDQETVARFGTDGLVFTVPVVLYGIFRYLYLIHQKGLGASPTDALLKDGPLAASVLLWIVVVWVVLYGVG